MIAKLLKVILEVMAPILLERMWSPSKTEVEDVKTELDTLDDRSRDEIEQDVLSKFDRMEGL